MLPYVASSPCSPASRCVVCQIYEFFDVFAIPRGSFGNFTYYCLFWILFLCHSETGNVPYSRHFLMCWLSGGLQRVRKKPVTVSNQRLGQVGQYSSKRPRPRDVFPERFTQFFSIFHLSYSVERPITACRYNFW